MEKIKISEKKVYCKHCKYIYRLQNREYGCEKGEVDINPLGERFFKTYCKDKNKNFDCPDFKFSLFAWIIY